MLCQRHRYFLAIQMAALLDGAATSSQSDQSSVPSRYIQKATKETLKILYSYILWRIHYEFCLSKTTDFKY